MAQCKPSMLDCLLLGLFCTLRVYRKSCNQFTESCICRIMGDLSRQLRFKKSFRRATVLMSQWQLGILGKVNDALHC